MAIKLAHAKDFASYLVRGAEDQTGKWPVIVPSLSLFTSVLALDFDVQPEIKAGEVEFGIVRIEKSTPLRIWDGLHRTVGAYVGVERLTKHVSELLTKVSRSRAAGELDKAAEFEAEIQHLKEVRRRLGLIVIPATITLETDEERIADLFTDVADNAKGINATALARLDHRNVFNGAAAAIFEGSDEWTLLVGLIDDDNAYVTSTTPTGPPGEWRPSEWRPMVLVRRVGAHWMAAGLSTQPRQTDEPILGRVEATWLPLG